MLAIGTFAEWRGLRERLGFAFDIRKVVTPGFRVEGHEMKHDRLTLPPLPVRRRQAGATVLVLLRWLRGGDSTIVPRGLADDPSGLGGVARRLAACGGSAVDST